jgi:hypothetical protein
MTRRRRATWSATAAALFIGAAPAAASAGESEKRPPPPVRASSTVEVIDSSRDIDEIIGRAGGQPKRPRALDHDGKEGQRARSGNGQPARDDTSARADELRAERPVRPRDHGGDGDKRDQRRQDRADSRADARRARANERAHDGRR